MPRWNIFIFRDSGVRSRWSLDVFGVETREEHNEDVRFSISARDLRFFISIKFLGLFERCEPRKIFI